MEKKKEKEPVRERDGIKNDAGMSNVDNVDVEHVNWSIGAAAVKRRLRGLKGRNEVGLAVRKDCSARSDMVKSECRDCT